jgi:hypothetical protein
MNGIKECVITEGNLQAEKSLSNFGNCNMWHLYIKNTSGYFESVQWMSVYNIQKFFKTKLPIYKEVGQTKYQLEN